MALITLEEAKGQLRVRHTEEDADIQRKADLATDLVLGYLEAADNVTGSPFWDELTVPNDVKAAILALTAELWGPRGDVAPPKRGPNGVFSEQVEGYLKMRRPIALA